jgi:adenine specific DNA methylase Mod
MMNHLKGFHFETMKEILVMMAIVKNLQENDFWKLETMLEFLYNCRRELL